MKLRILIALLVAACGDTTSNPPLQLNLDRPVDVAFACYGGLRITGGGGNESATPEQPVVLSAQPNRACEIRSAPRDVGAPVPVPPGQQDLTGAGGEVVVGAAWYGLILQQGPGTVAIAQFGTKPATAFQGGSDVAVLDADPLTPGKNSISIGEDPIAIVTDHTGCKGVTANAGSCDLSVLDLTDAFNLDGNVDVRRLEVTNAAGVPIRSKPAAMVTEPQGEVIGVSCPMEAAGLAYIAYPSCHLVAGVDLATGKIVTGIQYTPTGPQILTDLNITCPDECGGGSPATAGARPVAIDLEYDARAEARRLVIGAENTNAVTVVELDIASRPLSASQIALEGDVGVTALALSPVIGVGGQSGIVDDENGDAQYQFVYAVASDATVRVVEVHTKRSECDAQVDPRFVRAGFDTPQTACFAVGDPSTPPRRATARSPGIDLGPDEIPIGVDFTRADALVTDPRPPGTPARLIGYYAIVTAASGETFVITVDDDDYPDEFRSDEPLSVPVALLMPHQVRDAISLRSELALDENGQILCDNAGPVLSNGAVEGGPRAANTPIRNIPQGLIAPEKSLHLPSLRQLRCEGADSTRTISELSFAASPEHRDLMFPDWRALFPDETWSLTWEGSLSVDRVDTAVNGPLVRESMLFIDANGMHLRDQTKPYCEAGVEPFDIVQFRGCDPSLGGGDCPIGYRCYVHPQSQVQGIGACMIADEAERLADACKDFLTSIRRYTVARAESGELLLMPRRHELRTTPLDGCVSDEQCEQLADFAIRSPLSRHPSDPVEQQTTDPRTWVCRTDATRKPRGTSNKRCNMACDVTTDCAAGTVCVGGNLDTPDTKEGLCMEGVVPAQSCVNAPQRYELRAGEAFVVAGSRSGYVHPIIADANKLCVKDPDAHPLLTSRIPLSPPPCDPTADPITGLLPSGVYDNNPCSTTISHAETLPNYQPGTCDLAQTNPSRVEERLAPAIRYRSRGMNMTLVDPWYPGDQTCITDRLGYNGMPLDRVPQVFHGYSVSFRQQAGHLGLRVPIQPVFPVKVVRGPLNSIWIVDEGDFLSTSVIQPSTRGKVFRIEPHGLNIINTLE